jgi:D-glycero-D-manno-heptose 1,7-bisphosphate phosphatase
MKYIILDRDGVINHDSDKYIKSPDEWHPITGSLEAIAELNRAGYHVVIATNQSGVGRGYYDLEMLSMIHEKLMRELSSVGGYVDEIFFCPHHPDDKCGCRKPQPGMLYQIRDRYSLDLKNTYFIGDSSADIEACLIAGCKPLLVLTGNGQKTQEKYAESHQIPAFYDLAAAVQFVIASSPLTRVIPDIIPPSE